MLGTYRASLLHIDPAQGVKGKQKSLVLGCPPLILIIESMRVSLPGFNNTWPKKAACSHWFSLNFFPSCKMGWQNWAHLIRIRPRKSVDSAPGALILQPFNSPCGPIPTASRLWCHCSEVGSDIQVTNGRCKADLSYHAWLSDSNVNWINVVIMHFWPSWLLTLGQGRS